MGVIHDVNFYCGTVPFLCDRPLGSVVMYFHICYDEFLLEVCANFGHIPFQLAPFTLLQEGSDKPVSIINFTTSYQPSAVPGAARV